VSAGEGELTVTLRFRVYGVAQPKGSTKAFAYPLKNRATGQPIIGRNGQPVYAAATTSDNPAVKGWQQLVAEGASRALEAQPTEERERLAGAVRLTVAFYLPRPASLPKKVIAHLKKPDLDKLVRGVKDALTRVVWQDDSQVVEVVASKKYAKLDDVPHADIWVESTQGDEALVVPPAPLPLLEAVGQ
jgi:Holliday junction resolvase RusA-like endonuclease